MRLKSLLFVLLTTLFVSVLIVNIYYKNLTSNKGHFIGNFSFSEKEVKDHLKEIQKELLLEQKNGEEGAHIKQAINCIEEALNNKYTASDLTYQSRNHFIVNKKIENIDLLIEYQGATLNKIQIKLLQNSQLHNQEINSFSLLKRCEKSIQIKLNNEEYIIAI